MAINLISLKCPDCGASLEIEEGRRQCFCTYCGAKILIESDNEIVIREINEAEIKRAETDQYKAETDRMKAETDQRINMIKMKMAQKGTMHNSIITVASYIVAGLLGIVSVFGFLNSLRGGSDMAIVSGIMPALLAVIIALIPSCIAEYMGNNDPTRPSIKIPTSINGYKRKSYQSIKTIFESAGFSNVICTPLNDLTKNTNRKMNMVDTITVDSELVTGGGQKFPKDATVLITYHSPHLPEI